ncbi:MAG TPA: WD40 repeat domain-containing protein, partial [Gemmataceae bacterium]|nr:WD40 repeat domain-containing protein [Gemmataceae bacterium]
LKEHAKPVRALAYAPDGKSLASGGDDHKVCVWTTDKEPKATVLTGHPGEVTAVAWSPDSKTLASAGAHSASMLDAGLIKLWDAPKWQERKKAPAFAVPPVTALAFTGQGKTLLAASQSNVARFFDVASGKEQFALRGHLGWVSSLAVARGGDIVATGSVDGRAKIWMPSAMKTRDSIKASSEAVCSVIFSPDDRWLATGTGDGLVKLWHTASAEPAKTLVDKHTGAVLALAWSPNGKWLISGGADGKLLLWDMDPKSDKFGKVLDTVADAHGKAITCLGWGIEGVKQNMQGTLISVPHDKIFYSGSLDGGVKQWTVEGDKLRKGKEIANMGSGVLCLVHLPESQKIVATGHEDGKVRLSDYETGKPAMGLKTNVLTGHTGPVTGIVFKVYEEEQQRTSARLITASGDQTIKYWGYPGGEASLTVRGHGGPLTCLTLGPPGDDSLVTGSTDTTAKLWNPRGGQERWTFNPTGSAVRAVAVSNDSYTIVVGHQDGTVKIYRAGKAGTVIE